MRGRIGRAKGGKNGGKEIPMGFELAKPSF